MDAHTAKVIINLMLDDNMNENVKQALSVVNDALDKQTPKKPKNTLFGRECAVCGSIVELGENIARINCCPWCHHTIDWSDEYDE